MIHIQKQNEPPLLRKYKLEQGDAGTYEKFATGERFDELRLSLLEEQKYICCYCLQRIPEPLSKRAKNYKQDKDKLILNRMKTEHFHPKRGEFKDETKRLDYQNLLAACQGNDDSKKENHCDSSKKYKLLKYIPNPAIGKKKDFKRLFEYDVNYKNNEKHNPYKKEGEVLVFSKDENINTEINDILNLNEQNLRYKRFSVINPIITRIEEKKYSLKEIRKMINFYKEPNKDNKLHPFCDFVVYWLEKRFKKELNEAH